MKMLSSLLMIFVAGSAIAASPPTGNGVLEKLAQGGMTEVEAGKLAQTKATTPGVKEFAEMLVKDHTAANEKVKSLAAARKFKLPSAPSAAQQDMMKTLHARSGAHFDQAYLAAQVKAHEETVAMLKSEIASGQDAETKSLARELLPTVEKHLKEAYRLAGKEEREAELPSG
jgi:putative membrane protein